MWQFKSKLARSRFGRADRPVSQSAAQQCRPTICSVTGAGDAKGEMAAGASNWIPFSSLNDWRQTTGEMPVPDKIRHLVKTNQPQVISGLA